MQFGPGHTWHLNIGDQHGNAAAIRIKEILGALKGDSDVAKRFYEACHSLTDRFVSSTTAITDLFSNSASLLASETMSGGVTQVNYAQVHLLASRA